MFPSTSNQFHCCPPLCPCLLDHSFPPAWFCSSFTPSSPSRSYLKDRHICCHCPADSMSARVCVSEDGTLGLCALDLACFWLLPALHHIRRPHVELLPPRHCRRPCLCSWFPTLAYLPELRRALDSALDPQLVLDSALRLPARALDSALRPPARALDSALRPPAHAGLSLETPSSC